MTIEEFLGCVFAVCCLIVIGWGLYAFAFGWQAEPSIKWIDNNGSGHGEGNPYTRNGTCACEILVGVDNEPQDGGRARCTFGGGNGSVEWIPDGNHWIAKEGNYTYRKWNSTANITSWVTPRGIVRMVNNDT